MAFKHVGRMANGFANSELGKGWRDLLLLLSFYFFPKFFSLYF